MYAWLYVHIGLTFIWGRGGGGGQYNVQIIIMISGRKFILAYCKIIIFRNNKKSFSNSPFHITRVYPQPHKSPAPAHKLDSTTIVQC